MGLAVPLPLNVGCQPPQPSHLMSGTCSRRTRILFCSHTCCSERRVKFIQTLTLRPCELLLWLGAGGGVTWLTVECVSHLLECLLTHSSDVQWGFEVEGVCVPVVIWLTPLALH